MVSSGSPCGGFSADKDDDDVVLVIVQLRLHALALVVRGECGHVVRVWRGGADEGSLREKPDLDELGAEAHVQICSGSIGERHVSLF